jgi:hypothetical protein
VGVETFYVLQVEETLRATDDAAAVAAAAAAAVGLKVSGAI